MSVEDEEVYSGYDEDEVDDIKGITDEVTKYTFSGLNYPCVVLRDGFVCPEHKMEVLSKMVGFSSRVAKDITLYFQDKGSMYKIGMLSSHQMKIFYDLVGEDNVIAFYDDGMELTGDKKFVLCD